MGNRELTAYHKHQVLVLFLCLDMNNNIDFLTEFLPVAKTIEVPLEKDRGQINNQIRS